MRRATMAVGGLWMLLAIGCAHPKQQPSQYANGRAKLIEVYPEIGQAVLEMEDGSRVSAFWRTEATTAQVGTTSGAGSLSGPVGVYQETNVQRANFPAKAGDTIDFVGVWYGHEIMLGRVAVVR